MFKIDKVPLKLLDHLSTQSVGLIYQNVQRSLKEKLLYLLRSPFVIIDI